MSNIDKYQKVFMDVFEVSLEELNENFVFGDVEKWDSLAHMTLIAELEDAFEVMFETEDIVSYHSYENGMKILSKYGIAF